MSVLQILKPFVDGFACSSFFEAKLAASIGAGERTVHLTSPGMRLDEGPVLQELCDYISFNSLTQWQRFQAKARMEVSCGLRINPQLPFVKDDRYNPCRRSSKLGVPLDVLKETLNKDPSGLQGIEGIHFHNNCDSSDLSQLLETVKRVEQALGPWLRKLQWINIGGGYLFKEGSNHRASLEEAVALLRSKYGVTVFMEPGTAFVRSAGRLVSSVVDVLESDGQKVAVLDTTVNHMPEIFEYQCEPEVANASPDGKYKYVLAGGTCLAGDLFGTFAFDEPLEVGSQIVFNDAGSYTWVKAHTFNGINLPGIYIIKPDGGLVQQTRYSYEDFARRNGVEGHVFI